RDQGHPTVIPKLELIVRVKADRYPELYFGRRKPEIGRHYTHHLQCLIIDRDRTANDFWIAREFVPPQRIAEDDEVVASGPIFSAFERAPHPGRNTKQRK